MSEPVGPRGDLVDPDLITTEVARMRRHGLRAAASVSTPGGSVLVQPVGVRGRPESYLVAAVPGRVADFSRSSVMTTVALLSLAAERHRGRRDVQRRLRTRALEVLIAGDVRTAQLLLEVSENDVHWRLPSKLVVLRALGTQETREDAVRVLEEAVDLSALLHDELVLAVPRRALGQVVQALGRFSGLRVGVGEEMPLGELDRGHRTAGHALAATSEAAPVVHWEQTVREGALSLIEPRRAEAFAESLLGPLARDPEGELLTTLRSFLRHHGSVVRVAQELRVHRNTVRNRIGHIEGALRRSLDDPQTRVDAWLALQARATATRSSPEDRWLDGMT
jgi:purine catabolism regulator